MRRLLTFLILILAFAGTSARAQIITAQITVTNMPTNGFTFAINGHTRTWTNNVTSAANQIPTYSLVGTNIVGLTNANQFATNLLIAYISYIEANVRVQMLSSNVIQFQSYPSNTLTIATNGMTLNWVSWTFTTNTISEETVVRVPTNNLGTNEQTLVANGLIGWLNSTFDTNAVISTLPQWSNFVNASSLAALSNFTLTLGTNTSNFAKTIGLNNTNFTLSIGTLLTNLETNTAAYITNTWSNVFFGYLNGYFEPAGPGLSYLDGSGNIILTNGPGGTGGGQTRLEAAKNGEFQIFDEIGNDIIDIRRNGSATESHWADASIYRFWLGGVGTGMGGATVLQGSGGTGNGGSPSGWDFAIQATSRAVDTQFPISFGLAGWSATAIGAVTNFYDLEQNTGAGATAVDSVTVPGNWLTNNGDSILRELSVNFNTTGSARRIEVSFAAAGDVVDTGSGGITIAGAGTAHIRITITRTGPISYAWSSSVTATGPSSVLEQVNGSTVSSFNSGSGWTNSSAFPVVLTTTAITGNTGDLSILTDTVQISHSSRWATFQ